MRTLFRQGTDIEFNRLTQVGIIVPSDDEYTLAALKDIAGDRVSDHLYGTVVSLFVVQEALTDRASAAIADFLLACEHSDIRAHCDVVLTDPRRLQEGQQWAYRLNSAVRKWSSNSREDALYGAITATVHRPSVTYVGYHDFIASVLDPELDQLIVLGDAQTPQHELVRRLVTYDFTAAYRWS